MTQTTDAVTHSVLVPLEPDEAFELFTDRFGDWWPKDSHHIGDADAADVFLDARAGGRWYERAEDGSRVRLGPRARDRPPEPHPARLAPHAGVEFDPDPAKATQVEVTFIAEEDGRPA